MLYDIWWFSQWKQSRIPISVKQQEIPLQISSLRLQMHPCVWIYCEGRVHSMWNNQELNHSKRYLCSVPASLALSAMADLRQLIFLTVLWFVAISGERIAIVLCVLLVLPFDSSQACSFASISTLTLGVSTLGFIEILFEMCLDLAAKLTVRRDSWYSPGF